MSNFEINGYVLVEWDDTKRDPDFHSWRVYRRPTDASTWTRIHTNTGTADLYQYRDWLARSGVEYEYTVVQVANRFGSLVESVYQAETVTPVSTHYWLIHPTDEFYNLRLHHVTADTFSDEYEKESMNIIGRGRRVDYGERIGYQGSLTAEIRDDGSKTGAEQRALLEFLSTEMSRVWLRTPFGDLISVSLGLISFSRMAGVGIREFMTATIPYEEVA